MPEPENHKTADEQDAREIYAALENLCGDLYLLGVGEITLEDIYGGSDRDAMKALKKHQRFRDEGLQQQAIASKPLIPTKPR